MATTSRGFSGGGAAVAPKVHRRLATVSFFSSLKEKMHERGKKM
jgi:hypothetical protein